MSSTNQVETFEKGRRVVVGSEYVCEVEKTEGSCVHVNTSLGLLRSYHRKHVEKWPVMDIPHPLPVNSVVMAVPPDRQDGMISTIRFTGTDEDSLIYRIDNPLIDVAEVGPEAILDVRNTPDGVTSHEQ